MRPTLRNGRRAAPALPLLLLVLPWIASLAGAQSSPKKGAPVPISREEAARLSLANEILARRVELASGESFYLLLHPSEGRLQLMLKNAQLRDYVVHGLELGGPRVLFKPHALPRDWQGQIWNHGELDPPKDRENPELFIETLGDTAAAKSRTEEIGIPPTPEEAYPVPPRYYVRYEGGLSLEVRLPTTADSLGLHLSLGQKIGVWWNDLRSAAEHRTSDRMRLRVVLSDEDAKALYRALPPATRLLIIP